MAYPATTKIVTVNGNNYLVKRSTVWDKPVYTAYEAYAGHSTLVYSMGSKWGMVGSDNLTDELKALPFGDERIDRVDAFHQANCERAHQIILAAYPELDICRALRAELEGNN